jgi:hypothetical protein
VKVGTTVERHLKTNKKFENGYQMTKTEVYSAMVVDFSAVTLNNWSTAGQS